MALRAGHNCKALCLCLLGGRHYETVSFGVNCDRFLQEAVHTLGYGILEMIRAEYGRCSDYHHIHSGVDDFLVCVKTHEAVVGSKGLAFLLHLLQEGICLVFEGVAGRSDLDAVGSCQQIVDGAASAASATDQADFQFTAVRCLVGQVRNIVLTGLFERNKFCVPAFAAARRQDGCRSNYGRSSDSCTAAEKFSS